VRKSERERAQVGDRERERKRANAPASGCPREKEVREGGGGEARDTA